MNQSPRRTPGRPGVDLFRGLIWGAGSRGFGFLGVDPTPNSKSPKPLIPKPLTPGSMCSPRKLRRWGCRVLKCT